jgi:hypothetical protein
METMMTRFLAALTLGLVLAGCAATGYGGYAGGNPAYNTYGNTGIYDTPKGDHGGPFGG